MPVARSCPDCKVALAEVTSGSIAARRCHRCRGIWLDPVSFQRLCDEETRSPDDETGSVRSSGTGRPARRVPQDARVRYRACPECSEVMNRSNFARVSGVVIDVCRPHGAWFDRGELGAIRAFLRRGGLAKFARHRRNQAVLRSDPAARRPVPRDASVDDIYDVLAGSDASWDVPSRIPRLLVAAFFGAAGAWLLWRAFHAPGIFTVSLGEAPAVLGLSSLYFAWRALGQWWARRRR